MFALALRSLRAAHAPLRATPLTALLLSLAFLLAWDTTGLDLALAAAVGDTQGFALREHWLLAGLLHEGARRASWFIALALCVGVWWPYSALARLPFALRVQLAAGTLFAALAVSVLKGFSVTSCPWDLQAFGGIARYASHWSSVADGGAGHCFPAGHASSGFAFVAGYFAFRDHDRALAVRWLAYALAAGLLLGLAQQVRGAHFMSHTLWTAWVCFATCWTIDALRRRLA
jgi:membrane-associated PAP2 superfamily phosphatase